MAEFLMKPKIDFAFKEIMVDEKARVGFLSAILKVSPKEIKETRILNANLRREHEDDKQGILDVRLLMDNEQEIDIEIQLSELSVWADRSLFYLAKMFTEQIKPGESYRVFKKCVSISILDFKLFKEKELSQGDCISQEGGAFPEEGLSKRDAMFYSCFHIREDTYHFIYTDKMEFHVIELPKLPKELQENSSDIELWAKFINAERKEEFDMLAQKNPYIESAYQKLQIISQDKEKRQEYEAREKALRDYNEIMLSAEERGWEKGMEKGIEKGMEKGMAEGMEKGMAEGMEKGMEKGQYKKAIQVAQNMLKENFSATVISKISELPLEEVEELKAQYFK